MNSFPIGRSCLPLQDIEPQHCLLVCSDSTNICDSARYVVWLGLGRCKGLCCKTYIDLMDKMREDKKFTNLKSTDTLFQWWVSYQAYKLFLQRLHTKWRPKNHHRNQSNQKSERYLPFVTCPKNHCQQHVLIGQNFTSLNIKIRSQQQNHCSHLILWNDFYFE